MKLLSLVRIVMVAMWAGLSLLASAVESEDKRPDSVPDAPAEKSDGGAEQAAWEKKEAKLLKVLKEVVAGQAEARKDDTATDWNAVEANVKRYISSQVTANGEDNWPESQRLWVRAAHKDLQRDERHERGKFNYERELDTLNALEQRMDKEVEALKGPESDPEKASQAEEDETLWKFRDKSGSRTTKPRYKGQEPVN